jgi:hypothetical protein
MRLLNAEAKALIFPVMFLNKEEQIERQLLNTTHVLSDRQEKAALNFALGTVGHRDEP